MKRSFTLIAIVFFIFTLNLVSCQKESNLPKTQLRVIGNWKDCKSMEWAAVEFNKQNPNCTVVYEFLQGSFNESVKTRFLSEGDNRVDLFLSSTNIQKGHSLDGYAYDLMQSKDLDLSKTFQSLVDNYMYLEKEGEKPTKLYSIPLGAQMRGLYVNVTLLKALGIESIPKNQAELLNACKIIKQAGLTPFHGHIGVFAQQLLYPWICNNIANADDYKKVYDLVNSRDINATPYFKEIYEFLYTLIKNDYYNYYNSEEINRICKDSSADGYARSFFNIEEIRDENNKKTGEFKKLDDLGKVAFLPSALLIKSSMDRIKEDYHSTIEYIFIPAPIGKEAGYVYLSPGDSIAINKETENLEWSIKFLNFLFTPKNNKEFAKDFSVIPNTKDALKYLEKEYKVPQNHISELGQATFTWSFYKTLTQNTGKPETTMALPALSRANAPKNLNPETNDIYPFEYYWDSFIKQFTGE